jgi:aminopeptidase N
VGDEAFWAIIRGWYASKRGGNGTTSEFIALAERLSGQNLDDLFTAWLFAEAKPTLEAADARDLNARPARELRERAAGWLHQLQGRREHRR